MNSELRMALTGFLAGALIPLILRQLRFSSPISSEERGEAIWRLNRRHLA
jgi:hypothetical protein